MRALTGFVLSLFLLVAKGERAEAQSSLGLPSSASKRGHPPSAEDSRDRTLSLKDRFGIAAAERLLRSSEESERQRGLERLGALGTTRAMIALSQALEPGGAARTARDRLIAARALSGHAELAQAERGLIRLFAGTATASGTRDSPALVALVGETAAMALAASHRPRALLALARALRYGGHTAFAAANALLAYPPQKLGPVFLIRGRTTASLAQLLNRLADLRSVRGLRELAKRAGPEERALCAKTLSALGDEEPATLARSWLKQRDPTLRLLALEILAEMKAPDAPRAAAELLSDPVTRGKALHWVALLTHDSLVERISNLIDTSSPEQQPKLLLALAKLGTERAARAIAVHILHPEHAASAAYALATTPGSAAREALSRALSSQKLATLAVRAAVVRQLVLDERVPGTPEAVHKLLGAAGAADRAAAAWALAALDPEQAARLLKSRDRVLVIASARTAWHGDNAIVAAQRLVVENVPELQTALAISLADLAAAQQVPTRSLWALVEQNGVAAPLALRVLAARDGPELRSRIESYLKGDSPVLRTHVVLGLSHSSEPSATGLLADAYRFETSPEVRRAIIRALSCRSETVRQRTLWLALRLDPDPDVRELAQLALRGQRLEPFGQGNSTVWVSRLANSPGNPAELRRAAQVHTPSGLALPVLSDPDGVLVLTGLSEGSISFRLAAEPIRYNAQGR
ncbi:MAG TPA: HEAT repeat domain-containing protein [Polyangiaceae bacterium]